MSYINNIDEFLENNKPFFEYLKEMKSNLKTVKLEEIIKEAKGPEHVAVISVDVIEGFCRIGPLASDRIKGIITPIVELFKKAHQLGVENIVLPQDSHPADSPEFKNFPPHCITGTQEAETVKEFKELPFFDKMRVFEKESVNSGIDTGLKEWLLEKDLKKIVIVGDCTDLCIYHLAMFISHLGHTNKIDWEIIMPLNAVQTYDLPVEAAKQIGAVPHPGDLLHIVFMYHMALNGIKVVKEIG